MALSVLMLVLLVLVLVTPLYLFGHGVKIFIFYLTDIPGPSLWKLVTVHAKRLIIDGDMLDIVLNLCTYYEYKPCGIWIHGEYIVFISDHDSISTMFTSKRFTEKPAFMYENPARYIGKGLITLNGPVHKRHRKLLVPAFRKDLLEAHIPRLNIMELEDFLLQLEGKANGGMVCIQDITNVKAMSIASNILLSGHYMPDDIPRMVEALRNGKELTQKKTVNPIGFWLDTSNKRIEEDMNAFMTDMKKVLLEAKRVASTLVQDDVRRPNHFEVMYQKSNEKDECFTDDEYFGECKTLLAAGGETTAFTTLACLYCLALYPEEQERVYEELKSIFGKGRRDVGPEDLAQMVYLERAIKETLRILTPPAMIGRCANEDIILNGFKVPEGSVVISVLAAMHHNPKVYENPSRFDPTRFSPKNCAKRPKTSFAPFSGGFRDCPGQMQAYMVIKMLVSCVLMNFEVHPGDGLEKVEDIKLKMNLVSLLPDLPVRFVVRRERV